MTNSRKLLRQSMRTQWLLLALTLLLLAGVMVLQGVTDHRNITRQEYSRLQTQAQVIASNATRQLEATGLALASVSKDLAYPGELTSRRLMTLVDAMPGITTLLILDAQGKVAAANREQLIGLDAHGRDYFTAPQAGNDSSALFLSPPFKSVLGNYLFSISQRITSPTGAFDGVISAAIDPEYFQVLLASVLYAPDMSSSIIHGDGIRFMMVPEQTGETGRDLATTDSCFSRHRHSGRVSNVFTMTPPGAAAERVVALHTVQTRQPAMDKPLYVTCSRDRAAIFANWRTTSFRQGFVFSVVSLFSGAGLMLLQRRQQGLAWETAQAQQVRDLRLHLMEHTPAHNMQALLQRGLDEICRLGHSPIGFYHLVDTDQQSLPLQVWFSRKDEPLPVEGPGPQYPLGDAALVAACIRQRQPVIHNDFASLPPTGQVPLIRELVVPICRENRVVAVLGLANKASDYRPQDLDQVSTLAEEVWEISARKQNEGERLRLGLHYQTLLTVASDGIHILDMHGNLVEANAAFRRMLGYAEGEDLPRNVAAWDVSIPRENIVPTIWDLMRVPATFETKHRRRDGTVFDVEISACGVQLEGVWYLYSSSRDISKRKEMEVNLTRSNRELEQFAYVASHDLQEPLRKIASFTELLANRTRGTLDEKGETYMGYIVDGATRMRTLINDLLSFSRVASDRRELSEVDCAKLVASLIRDMQPTIRGCNAEINCGELPILQGEAHQLEQLFQNLLGNALKYRSAAPPRITISATRQRHDWLFAVADNGIGIAAVYHERIFTIFQRLHSRVEYPGTGIGLSICHKIVERHGGKIWVESSEGAGATFFFTLPGTPDHQGRTS